jgi:hypothetical protein
MILQPNRGSMVVSQPSIHSINGLVVPGRPPLTCMPQVATGQLVGR